MRAFTLKTNIVAKDKASKQMDKITASSMRMTKTITRESRIAGRSFARFSQNVNRASKRALVSINNIDARVNRFGRNIKKRLGKLGTLGVGIGLAAVLMSVVDANIQLDKSFASLSAITGKTGKEFEAFKIQVASVAKEQKLFAGDTAKAFEIVASAKPELLANADALAKVTNAAIILSKASGDDLAKSSLSLTGVMNQFNLEASEAERVMNALAAGSVAGSANITNVAASMKNFGAVAAGANITMEQSVALVEVMGSKSIFAEEAGTKLRGSILKLQQAGVGYASGQFMINDALTEARIKFEKLGTAQKRDTFLLKTFGAENITTGQILLNNIKMFGDMTTAVTGTTTAVDQMNINTNTFSNRLLEMQASFKNSISATQEQGGQMQQLKDAMAFVAENMDKIISVIIIAIKIFAALKAGLILFNIVMWATSPAVAAAAAATWAFTVALLANPITWIVLGIVALVAIIVLLIKNWDAVKLAIDRFFDTIRNNPFLSFLFRPILLIIDAVKFLIANFDTIKASIMNFWKIIKESPIIQFLLKPIIAVINHIKFLIKGIKAIAGLFGSSNEISVGQKLTKSETKDIKITRLPTKIAKKVNTDTKLIDATNKNTTELNKNTNSTKAQWKGKFFTSILKDANVTDRTISREIKNTTIQKELAMSVIDNEVKNSSIQNEIITNTESALPTNVITKANSQRRSNNNKISGNININVVDKTGGNFAVEVESTGVDTTTTGNV